MGVSGQHHAPASFTRGKTRYPSYRRPGRPRSRSGWVRKISRQPGFDLRTFQPVASVYTDYTIPAPPTVWNSYALFHGRLLSSSYSFFTDLRVTNLRYCLSVHGWHTPECVWYSLLSADGPICVIDFSGVRRDDWQGTSHVVAHSSVLPTNTRHKKQSKVSHFRVYYLWFSWLCLYILSGCYLVTGIMLSNA